MTSAWRPATGGRRRDSQRRKPQAASHKPAGDWRLAVRIAIVLTTSLFAAPGCQTGYVLSQGWGLLKLYHQQVSLDNPRLERELPPESREKLRWVPKILAFARDELDLDPGDSYEVYLDTSGESVAYAVAACHPLALVPYLWHFPFVGAVPFKGYFEEEDARTEAKRLEAMGFETAVLFVGAFSTLGWLRDPVLSSNLKLDLPDLVDLLIHETTHRTLYFPSRSSFNESLATHVAREGTLRFLSSRDELKGLVPRYLASREASMQRERCFLRLRDDLDALYRSDLPEERRKARKAEIFATASSARRKLGLEGEIPASNAVILSVADYHEFEGLLARFQEIRGGHPARLVAYLQGLPRTEDPVGALEREIAVR